MIVSLLKPRQYYTVFSLALVMLLAGCATTGNSDPQDPFEGFNRGVYTFNQTADDYVFNPVGRFYNTITPQMVDEGVTNFFSNLTEIARFANNLLQFKIGGAAVTTSRFMINSTLGLAGFLDVSSVAGLPKQQEDFGQTLGYWGVDAGPYLVLPFFGPSTVRDTTGFVADSFLNPVVYLDNDTVVYSLFALGYIDAKSDLLATGDLVSEAALDEYDFVKSAYLERRRNLVNDRDPSTSYEEDYEEYEEYSEEMDESAE